MKASESMVILQKMNECRNGECPEGAKDCGGCPYYTSPEEEKEAVKTALIYLALVEEREGEE